MDNHETEQRKSEHLDIVLHQKVTSHQITNGLERYRFRHEALPEINFSHIDIGTKFLNKTLLAPFAVSSMTGGTDSALYINQNLALAAQERGWAMGLGSVRAALEHPEVAETFRIRKYAPDILLFANLGAVQLNYGYGVDECKQIIDLTEADALILHLNSLQEVFQPEGNTNFQHLFSRIEALCSALDVPVGVKEVGWGIHGELATRLYSIGVAFIDVAGAGGTSWSQVEKYRSPDNQIRHAAEAFTEWGIPTSDCIIDVRKHAPHQHLIASGGINTGVEGAKSLALGADLVGIGRSLLHNASSASTPDTLISQLKRIEWELKVAMFGIGCKDIPSLKGTNRIALIHP
ncbi:type 2 isopentenyl-diphosphate Delta-isomerase [Marininema halotolerans]|uniref:Isopentenyl-diphosphate delta-isomerase n=1 Tax=Marininema halotolerans TaxID=1155944 RepID=A0A1I6S0M6_9BACL|nr:type 2 isopentenyl-diphosphate Delta-isomerase [Marininema halotolerans]SFS70501.1 isopentenyl-diphosphate delta-isomerase [Marininema halotolerans]